MALREVLPRQRLKLLWLIQQVRSERHTTIRDLLAALSYAIAGHEDMYRLGDEVESPIQHPCAFVERETATGESLALFRRLFYNSTFSDEDIYEGRARLVDESSGASTDRTFGMAPVVVRDHLNFLDPARGLSNDYWDDLEDSVVADAVGTALATAERAASQGYELEGHVFERIANRLQGVAQRLDEVEPSNAQYGQLLETHQWLTYLLIRTIKRRAFFVEDVPLSRLTRFASLNLFLRTLGHVSGKAEDIEAYEEAVLSIIPRGLLQAEGVILKEVHPRFLEVRWSSNRAEVGALLLLPLSDPALLPQPHGVEYVESFPSRLTFTAFDFEEQPTLTLSLDAFEGLFRLASGYHEGFAGVPRTSQLRNFREALRGINPQEMEILSFAQPNQSVKVTLGRRIRFE